MLSGASQRILFLAVLSTLAVATGAVPATAREVPTGAAIGAASQPYVEDCPNCGPGGTPTKNPRCTTIDIVTVSPVAGATGYTVTVSDTRLGERSISGSPPFPAQIDGINVPANTLGGLSSNSGPAPCTAQTGRYQVIKAVATLNCSAIAPRSAVEPPVAGIALNRSAVSRTWWNCASGTVKGLSVISASLGWLGGRLGPRLTFNQNPATPPQVRAAGAVMIVLEEPLVWGGAAGFTLANALDVLASDPPDPNFKVIAKPKVRRPDEVRGRDSTTRALAPAANAYMRAAARVTAYGGALRATIDRAGGANLKRDRTWVKRQLLASADQAEQLASALTALASTGERLGRGIPAALQSTGTNLAEVEKFQRGLAGSGLPKGLRTMLTRDVGLRAKDLPAFTLLARASIAADAAKPPFWQLTDAEQLSTLREAAKNLRAYARATRKNPSIPSS
jgi:hypothetical protein